MIDLRRTRDYLGIGPDNYNFETKRHKEIIRKLKQQKKNTINSKHSLTHRKSKIIKKVGKSS